MSTTGDQLIIVDTAALEMGLPWKKKNMLTKVRTDYDFSREYVFLWYFLMNATTIIMRPSSLGGGRILRRTVCPSVCPSVPL